jgi:hypothetical protein
MQIASSDKDFMGFIKVILENKSDPLLSRPMRAKGQEIPQVRDLGTILSRRIKNADGKLK